MAGRRPAKYTEQTVANTLKELSSYFSSSEGSEKIFIPIASATEKLVQAYRIMPNTAQRLLAEAVEAGGLVWLKFSNLGYLVHAIGANQEKISPPDHLRFVKDGYFGPRQVKDLHSSGVPMTEGVSAVARMDLFQTWVKELQDKADDALSSARVKRQEEQARLANDYPAVAALADWSKTLKGKSEEFSVSSGYAAGDSFVHLRLYGPVAEKLAPELLALLHKHFGEPTE